MNFVVVEGKGRTVVTGQTLEWRPHDVFVVPSWREHRHEAIDESLLFSFSDRLVREKLEYGANAVPPVDAAGP